MALKFYGQTSISMSMLPIQSSVLINWLTGVWEARIYGLYNAAVRPPLTEIATAAYRTKYS